MKIILATNKTLPRNGRQELDTGYFYLYKPLIDLGHEVHFYDIISPMSRAPHDFNKVVEDFSPDLVFCCFTGNPQIAPYEDWDSILKLTRLEKVTTFNWFCDDTWRFDDFSKRACWYFNYCSTPEPAYVQKYKDIGYDNIILGGWHANSECYPPTNKEIDISFAGGMTVDRGKFFRHLTGHRDITVAGGLDIEELFNFYCKSKIGINLSINSNDPQKKTQMKQRIFELAAAKSVVLTEYHEGVEEFFDVGTEIVTFSDVKDFVKKVDYLFSHPQEAEEIAENGHKRFLKDHDSKIRLKKVLEDITNVS